MLVLHFFFYALKTFLILDDVICYIAILMKLLSTLSATKQLENLKLFHLTSLVALVTLM